MIDIEGDDAQAFAAVLRRSQLTLQKIDDLPAVRHAGQLIGHRQPAQSAALVHQLQRHRRQQREECRTQDDEKTLQRAHALGIAQGFAAMRVLDQQCAVLLFLLRGIELHPQARGLLFARALFQQGLRLSIGDGRSVGLAPLASGGAHLGHGFVDFREIAGVVLCAEVPLGEFQIRHRFLQAPDRMQRLRAGDPRARCAFDIAAHDEILECAFDPRQRLRGLALLDQQRADRTLSFRDRGTIARRGVDLQRAAIILQRRIELALHFPGRSDIEQRSRHLALQSGGLVLLQQLAVIADGLVVLADVLVAVDVGDGVERVALPAFPADRDIERVGAIEIGDRIVVTAVMVATLATQDQRVGQHLLVLGFVAGALRTGDRILELDRGFAGLAQQIQRISPAVEEIGDGARVVGLARSAQPGLGDGQRGVRIDGGGGVAQDVPGRAQQRRVAGIARHGRRALRQRERSRGILVLQCLGFSQQRAHIGAARTRRLCGLRIRSPGQTEDKRDPPSDPGRPMIGERGRHSRRCDHARTAARDRGAVARAGYRDGWSARSHAAGRPARSLGIMGSAPCGNRLMACVRRSANAVEAADSNAPHRRMMRAPSRYLRGFRHGLPAGESVLSSHHAPDHARRTPETRSRPRFRRTVGTQALSRQFVLDKMF